jgi:hypothetical protein
MFGYTSEPSEPSPPLTSGDVILWSILGGVLTVLVIGGCLFCSRGWWMRSFRAKRCDHECERGKKGKKGDKGCPGEDGCPGQRGSQIVMQPGPPAETVTGEAACCVLMGDIYIDVITGIFYQYLNCSWVQQPYSLNPPLLIQGPHTAQGLWTFAAMAFTKTTQSAATTFDPLIPLSSWVSLVPSTALTITISSISPGVLDTNGAFLILTNESGVALTIDHNNSAVDYPIFTATNTDYLTPTAPYRATFVFILDKTDTNPGWRIVAYNADNP